jgi:peptide deformylase
MKKKIPKIHILSLGNPILRSPSTNFSIVDGKFSEKDMDVLQKVRRKLKILKGFGLAAPQIGENKRCFVMTLEKDQKEEQKSHEIEEIINPVILDKSLEMGVEVEACFSIPYYYGLITRHKEIKVQYLNNSGIKIIFYKK